MKIIIGAKRNLKSAREILVDDEDFNLLNKYRWCFVYRDKIIIGVNGNIKGKRPAMGKFLLKPKKGFVVDHIDGNPLNNQRKNLRICTLQQNCMNRKTPKSNTTGARGVTIDKTIKNGKEYVYYRGQLTVNGIYYNKRSKDIKECITFIKEMEEKYQGEFRRSIPIPQEK